MADSFVPDSFAPDTKSTPAINPQSNEAMLMDAAKKAGMQGKELAAFMAQMSHESDGFQKLSEVGGGSPKYGGGATFKGRGFIQLTHDFNYRDMSKKLGVDLIGNPDLAADPKIATQVAIRYWMDNVRPKVKNWDDVFSHTKAINNPSAKDTSQVRGFEDRQARYNKYKNALAPAASPKVGPTEYGHAIVQVGNTTARIPKNQVQRLIKDNPGATIISYEH